jgi:hypothetical protein
MESSADWVVAIVARLAATSSVSNDPGDVSPSELQRLRVYLATHVLLTPRRTWADGSIAGHRHPETGQPIRLRDPLTVQVAKYVKHVFDEGEWDPDSTGLSDYLNELSDVVLDEQSELYLEDDAGHWKLTFGRYSPASIDDEIEPYTVVSFIPVKGLWLTGFRPERGRAYVTARGSGHSGRWIGVTR